MVHGHLRLPWGILKTNVAINRNPPGHLRIDPFRAEWSFAASPAGLAQFLPLGELRRFFCHLGDFQMLAALHRDAQLFSRRKARPANRSGK
jgi:hypothetical protein